MTVRKGKSGKVLFNTLSKLLRKNREKSKRYFTEYFIIFVCVESTQKHNLTISFFAVFVFNINSKTTNDFLQNKNFTPRASFIRRKES